MPRMKHVKLSKPRTEVEQAVHDLGNVVNHNVIDIEMIKKREEGLNVAREEHNIRLTTLERNHEHTDRVVEGLTSGIKEVATEMKELATEMKSGFALMVKEISNVSQKQKTAQVIIDLVKPLIYAVILGIGSYFVYLLKLKG